MNKDVYNDTLGVSPYWYLIVNMYLVPFLHENNGVTSKIRLGVVQGDWK